MTIFSILSLFGGLAVFLYGMLLMGEGLEKSSGGKLKAFLGNATKKPLHSVLLGAGVTAIIQSSSATTVMVVGFVNSGIMELSQSIGVIMGANIGTTITAWILGLTGITSDNIFVQLFKSTNLAFISAVIGILTIMISKNSHKKDIGTILLGFSILMLGMNLMSTSVEPLADIPAFTNTLTLFSNPLLGILMGAVLTAIIQSSSASVGILQALAATGTVSYAVAIPIIMGQNIGTCITAMLSSIGTNKNAKRTAVVHLCFNIIGTFAFLILYYIVRIFIGIPFINDPINAPGIAVIHTSFNLFATVIMFPFIKQLEKLAYIIIKRERKAEHTQLLDERLLFTPAVAIAQSKKLTDKMARLAEKSLLESISMVFAFDKKIAEKIRTSENEVDDYEDRLGSYLVKVSQKNLTVEDSHEVSNLLHCIGDFERISDHSINILEVAEEIHDKNIVFSNSAREEIQTLSEAIREILHNTVEAFINEDTEAAKNTEPLEQVVDKIRFILRDRHISRLQAGECTITAGFIFSDFLNNCERVSDHCSNIAVSLIKIPQDSFDTHEYLRNIKSHGEPEFDRQFKYYDEKYSV